MRKFIILLALFLSCQLSAVSSRLFAAAKIIAIVNSDAITEKDLEDSLRIMRAQLMQQYKGKDLDKEVERIRKDLLQRLIEDRLMVQEANRLLAEAEKNKDAYAVFRLQVKPEKIKARVEEIKKAYPSESAFEEDISKSGISQGDLESKIKDQMLMENVIDFWVRSLVTVRPEEVTTYYNKNPEAFETGEEREVLVITLDSEDLAKSLSYNLRTGQKLEDLATRYPFTVNNLNANKNKGELRKDIEDIVFKLGISEVSNPLKIEGKYHIFILQNIVPSRKLPLAEVQSRVYVYLYKSKMSEQMTKWLDELKKKSYIKITQQ
jgi:peptidyl-prolyl cis-trans isomerase SurA